MRQLISLMIGVAIVGGGIYFVKSQLSEEALEKTTQENTKQVKQKVDNKVDNFRNKLNENLPDSYQK